MYTALYYPHITIRNGDLIKTALLLWDNVEYIVPDKYVRARSHDRNIQEAFELITKPHLPTLSEKRRAHELIVQMVNSGLPDWFLFSPNNEHLIYEIYPQKFLPETWEIVCETVKIKSPRNDTYKTNQLNKFFGISMMSILADCCAGTQKRTITDEIDSYSYLTRYITSAHGGSYGNISEELERLVTISLKIIDVETFELKRLIDLRKREEVNNDDFLRKLRHNYLEAVDRYVNRISFEARSEEDINEIERIFEQELSDDLKGLRERLKIDAKIAILKVLAAVTTVLRPFMTVGSSILTSDLIGVGSLYEAKINYSKSRRKSLEDHAMSWLYTAKSRHPLF